MPCPAATSLNRIGPDEYDMKMKMVISSVQGLFAGKVRIEDQNPPQSFKLTVEGTGKVGFMRGTGVLTLTPEGEGTQVAYDGEVQVGGMIAGVGQRLLDTSAKFVIRKFFDKLSEQVTGAQKNPASSTYTAPP